MISPAHTQQVARMVAEAKQNGTQLTVAQVGAATGLMDTEIRTILANIKKPAADAPPLDAARNYLTAHTDAPGPGIATAARRALAALAKFETVLAADADKAKIRAELAKAQAEVARLKSELSGKPATPTAPAGPGPIVTGRAVPCPQCDHTTPTEQGMRIHLGQEHRSAA